MGNYMAMSKKTHDIYREHTKSVLTSIDLSPFGIGVDKAVEVLLKINDELEDNLVIIKINDDIHGLTIDDIIKHIKKEEE